MDDPASAASMSIKRRGNPAILLMVDDNAVALARRKTLWT